MIIKVIYIYLCLMLTLPAFAKTLPDDVLTEFSEDNIVVLNESLRSIKKQVNKINKGSYFLVHKGTTAQTIDRITTTKLTWSTEVFDSDNAFTSNTFTPTKAGMYFLHATSVMASIDDTTYSILYLYKNGSAVVKSKDPTSGTTQPSISYIAEANGTTDYFDVYLYHNDGDATADVAGGSNETYFMGYRIAD